MIVATATAEWLAGKGLSFGGKRVFVHNPKPR